MFTTNVDALHLHVCFDARPRWCGVRTTARKTPPSSVRRWPAFWTTWGSSTSPAMSWSKRYTHLVSKPHIYVISTEYLRNIYNIYRCTRSRSCHTTPWSGPWRIRWPSYRAEPLPVEKSLRVTVCGQFSGTIFPSISKNFQLWVI